MTHPEQEPGMDIDQIVAEWNAVVATGDSEKIEAAKKKALQEIAQLTMEDDLNYRAAGYGTRE